MPFQQSTGAAACPWRIRVAGEQDTDAIVAAAECLLAELGAAAPAPAAMKAAARRLLDDGDSGALLVAETGGELIGMLSASWQTAIHVPGEYALIQDLWVNREWRSQAIGATLIAAVEKLARGRGVRRIEVGLPRDSFSGLQATEAFYTQVGFSPLGARMRRIVP